MDKALQTMIDNMPEKTGKSLPQWQKILAAENFEKHMQAVNFLKKQHGVTHGFANTIVTLSKDSQDTPEDVINNQYQGKESLKPIYDKLVSAIQLFGQDVVISPKKTAVSLVRRTQFALIKPATKKRIDLGLKLKDEDTTDRLENSGPFGTMCTHRVQVFSIDDIDQELINWLKLAYHKAQ